MNVVILRGTLSRPPELRELRSNDLLLTYDLTVEGRDGGPAESVPCVWFGAPAIAADYPAGEDVLVIGRVRRRFFRSGGQTLSRTEVVVDKLVPARRQRACARAIAVVLDDEVNRHLADFGDRLPS